jgi:hypothetical protein
VLPYIITLLGPYGRYLAKGFAARAKAEVGVWMWIVIYRVCDQAVPWVTLDRGSRLLYLDLKQQQFSYHHLFPSHLLGIWTTQFYCLIIAGGYEIIQNARPDNTMELRPQEVDGSFK